MCEVSGKSSGILGRQCSPAASVHFVFGFERGHPVWDLGFPSTSYSTVAFIRSRETGKNGGSAGLQLPVRMASHSGHVCWEASHAAHACQLSKGMICCFFSFFACKCRLRAAAHLRHSTLNTGRALARQTRHLALR